MIRVLQSFLWCMTAWYGLHEGNKIMLFAFFFLSFFLVVILLICIFAPRDQVKGAMKNSKKTSLTRKVFYTALMGIEVFVVAISGSPEVAASFCLLMIFAECRIESVKSEVTK